jgi:hypothetical protein
MEEDLTKRYRCMVERGHAEGGKWVAQGCANAPVYAYYSESRGQLYEFCQDHEDWGRPHMRTWNEKTHCYE